MHLCGGRLVCQVDASHGGIRQPPSAAHHDAPNHGHGIDPIGVHFGFPAVASTDLGFKVWLGDRAPGAAFAAVEPGAFAIRYGVGYMLTDRPDLTRSSSVTGEPPSGLPNSGPGRTLSASPPACGTQAPS
jgi:hypothetical protein